MTPHCLPSHIKKGSIGDIHHLEPHIYGIPHFEGEGTQLLISQFDTHPSLITNTNDFKEEALEGHLEYFALSHAFEKRN